MIIMDNESDVVNQGDEDDEEMGLEEYEQPLE
jgi:hypothetical protein